MKRLRPVLVMYLLLSMTAFAEEPETFTSGDFEYVVLDDGTAEITNYTGTEKKVIIPELLGGREVSGIGDSAFFNYDDLISVTFPESLKSIGDEAFCNCDNLYNVTLPEKIRSIGSLAFSYCDHIESIILPDSIEVMGDNPFRGCQNIRFRMSPDHLYLAEIDDVLFSKPDKRLISFTKELETYTIPDGIRSIGGWAFYGSALTSIILPDSLKEIGNFAFHGCDMLNTITLPDSIETIGSNPFENCSSLDFNVSESHPFFSCAEGTLFSKKDKKLICSINNKDSYSVPDEVQIIGDSAFANCDRLISISLPDSVTQIGNNAFYGCENLVDVVIPDSVTNIGHGAFRFCSNLESIEIPDSVMSIGNAIVAYCSNVTITVSRDSYAAEYCKNNGLDYTYPDANEWLSD